MKATPQKGRASQTKSKIKNQGEPTGHQNQSGKDRKKKKKEEDTHLRSDKNATKSVGGLRSIDWDSL